MGAEQPCRGSLREHLSLICTICIEGSPQLFDALLARLHQQSMLIFAMIALGHPKLALKPFQWLQESSRCFRVISSLEPLLDCSKTVYFHTTSNSWFRVKEPNYFRCWARRPSMIAALRLYSARSFNIATILRNLTVY